MFFYICICICIIMYLSYSNICLFIIDFFTTHCKLTLSLVTLNSVRSSWTGCPRGCDERSCDLPWRQRCFQHPIYHGRLWGYEEVKSPIFPLYDNHYQSFKSLFKSYPFARTTRGNIRQMIEDHTRLNGSAIQMHSNFSCQLHFSHDKHAAKFYAFLWLASWSQRVWYRAAITLVAFWLAGASG